MKYPTEEFTANVWQTILRVRMEKPLQSMLAEKVFYIDLLDKWTLLKKANPIGNSLTI